MRFYFAHQSVGADIVTGLGELAERSESVANVDVMEYHQANSPAAANPDRLVIIHQRVGANREPLSKIAAFRATLDTRQGPEIDFAMLKFCYVDVVTAAEAQSLWGHYENMIEQLSTAHPEVRLVHCTVPLRSLPSGPYAWLRRVLGHRHPAVDA